MKALVLEISFFEAFFKVHYTKGFRLTYQIPLPTTVAGIFGAMLGIEREKLNKEFANFLFGAKILDYENITPENATYLQYKSQVSKIEKGSTQIFLVNEPTYLISIAGDANEIYEIKKKMDKNIIYLPYGGQNDFFVKDWKIIGVDNVIESNEISNYAPQDWVENLILEKGSEIHILRVRHKLSENINFYFVVKGRLKVKQQVLCTKEEKIGLYRLEQFYAE